ncbi:MAG: reverse transcriptase domain-containing protein, partial [Sphingobacterium sp.]
MAEIARMKELGAIVPSKSPFCTYLVAIVKKDGGLRVAIDYRALNDVTVDDKMPLPNISDLLDETSGSKFFSLLDLQAGFWQIPMAKESQPYTAFRTQEGHFEFTVMPFGLKNAPATFQRWTGGLFADLRWEGVLVYIDDILIHTATESRHLELLEVVLERLRANGAVLKLSKCSIAPRSVLYLGHILEDGIRRPNQSRVKAIQNLRVPRNVKDVRALMGVLSYFRNYVPHFSERTYPITQMLRKNAHVIWTDEMQVVVWRIIQDLSQAALSQTHKGQAFRLETDASDIAMGAVLYDRDQYEAGERLPVTFLSKKFTPAERNWTTQARECYAMVWALEACDSWIRGREVDVCFDCKNLVWLKTATKGIHLRWISRFAEYHPNFINIPGSKNIVADLLSRCVEDDPVSKSSMWFNEALDLPSVQVDLNLLIFVRVFQGQDVDVVSISSDSDEERLELPLPVTPRQRIRPSAVLNQPEKGKFAAPPVTLEQVLDAQAKVAEESLPIGVKRFEERLMYRGRVWVPEEIRPKLLDFVHFSGGIWHPSAYKMQVILRVLFDWERMKEHLVKYVQACFICQRARPGLGAQTELFRKHPRREAFATLYVDLWGPVEYKGTHHTVLTMLDFSTKWAEVAEIPEKTSEAIAHALFTHWIARFGPPAKLVSDNEASL